MTSGFGKRVMLTLALGILASGMFAMISVPISSPDAAQYERLGYNLASGHGFSLNESAPYLPTMFREPAYPFFIAIMYRVFGHRPESVIFAQVIMHAVTGLLAYLIAREIFSEKTAYISGVAVALFPTLASASAYMLSETFFTFVMCMGIYVFLKAINTKRLRLFLISGSLFGLLALTKMAALLLPFLLAMTALFVEAVKRRGMRRFAPALALFILVFMLIVSIWSVRNKAQLGTYSLTVRSGWCLWSRAEKLDDSPREMLATACYSISEHLGDKVFPDNAGRPERFLYRDLDKAGALLADYRNKGFTELEADEMLRKEAVARISRNPLKHLAYTPVEAIKMAAFTYLPILNEPRTVGYFNSSRVGRFLLIALKASVRILAWPLLLLSLLGAVVNLRNWDRWILIFMVPAYFNIVCSLVDATARYGVPLIPIYCIMAAAVWYRPAAPVER